MNLFDTSIDAAYYFAFAMCFVPGPWNGHRLFRRVKLGS